MSYKDRYPELRRTDLGRARGRTHEWPFGHLHTTSDRGLCAAPDLQNGGCSVAVTVSLHLHRLPVCLAVQRRDLAGRLRSERVHAANTACTRVTKSLHFVHDKPPV